MARDLRGLTALEEWLRQHLKHHCLVLASLQRTIAHAQSRISWLSEGDANTWFSHLHARYRQRKKFVAKNSKRREWPLAKQTNRTWWEFYNSLLGTVEPHSHTLCLPTFYHMAQDLQSLDAPISTEQVWNVIADKAPGPDGYTGRFYKACWPIINTNLMAAIGALHTGDSRMLHHLNGALMVLIPKKWSPSRSQITGQSV